MPATLMQFDGKEIIVKLDLTEANIDGESNVFEATDLCDISMVAKVPEYSHFIV